MPQISPINWVLAVTFFLVSLMVVFSVLPAYCVFSLVKQNLPIKSKLIPW